MTARRLLLAEKQGRVLVFEPDGNGGFRAPTVLLDIRDRVRTSSESGLLGMAVSPGSERIVLSGLPRATDIHNAGGIGFRG